MVALSFARLFVLSIGLSGCSLVFDGDPPDAAVPPDAPIPIDVSTPILPDAGVAPFAIDQPGIYEMAVDATHLYWVDNGQFDHEANIRRMPLGGGPIETLFSAPERMYALAVADGYVYAAHTGPNYAGHVYRIPAAGGAATTIATAFNPTSVSVDGAWVYFTEAVSPRGRILRVPTSGGTPEVVVDDVDNPWDIAADDGVVFYSEMNRGRMMRVIPGASPVELASGWVGTGWMTVDASFVYFVAGSPPRLMRVSREGGAPETLLAGTSNEVKLSISDGSILWGANALPLAGGAASEVDGADLPIAVTATTDAFYVADFFTGAIYRAPR